MTESYGLVFIFSVLGYCGLGLVLTLIRKHGALAAVTGRTGTTALAELSIPFV